MLRSLIIILAAAVLTAAAAPKPASVFGNGMVLQQGMAVPVWGSAEPGERITVSVAGRSASAVTGEDGRWRVSLAPLTAGGPYEMTVSGRSDVIFSDVMAGEVWICSGQSNMTFALRNTVNAAEEIASAEHPLLRLFTVRRVLSDTLRGDVEGRWERCTPGTVEDFSAVAYFFGRRLADSLGVPVGLVHVSWGGTAAEGWMPRSVLLSDPDFRPIIDRWTSDSVAFPAAMKAFTDSLPALSARWSADSAAAVSLGRALPRKPTAPRGPGHRDTPCGQYNGMLHPLIPFAMRGVIWYQGEGNAARAHQYRRLFPTLITTWRSLWGQGVFPFYYVQLPNLDRQPEPSRSGWAELREAQLMALSLPNTGMAVTIDVGDPKDLHPREKRPVAERLARIALAKTYGRPVPYSGPLYRTVERNGKSIIVRFDHADGLRAHGTAALTGFTVAGDDRKFVPANAVIRDGAVIVSHPSVPAPAAVRYAWADAPACNLTNATGLPASPFRTDDWEEVTHDRK